MLSAMTRTDKRTETQTKSDLFFEFKESKTVEVNDIPKQVDDLKVFFNQLHQAGFECQNMPGEGKSDLFKEGKLWPSEKQNRVDIKKQILSAFKGDLASQKEKKKEWLEKFVNNLTCNWQDKYTIEESCIGDRLLPYFNLQEIKVELESPKEKEEETLAKDERLTKDVKYLSDATIIYCMKKKED